jgi:hypothetical protein
MKSKQIALITQAAIFLVGVVSGVLGNFVYDGIRGALAGSAYQYGTNGPVAPACGDTRSGWTPEQAQIGCPANAMTLQVSAAPETGEAVFVDPRQPFPQDYRVSVTMSLISPSSCAGILIRGHPAQATGYVAFICSRGVWEISRFDAGAEQPVVLATGVLPPSASQSYTVAFATQGTVYQLLINGVLTGGGDESLSPGTETIALLVSPSGSATFANFIITETR